ncbi:hypothetical protein MRX96_005311 [Rhipicephalus microplus]
MLVGRRLRGMALHHVVHDRVGSPTGVTVSLGLQTNSSPWISYRLPFEQNVKARILCRPDIVAVGPFSPAETKAGELYWRGSNVSISRLAGEHHLGTQWRTAIVIRRACRQSCRECCRARQKRGSDTKPRGKTRCAAHKGAALDGLCRNAS